MDEDAIEDVIRRYTKMMADPYHQQLLDTLEEHVLSDQIEKARSRTARLLELLEDRQLTSGYYQKAVIGLLEVLGVENPKPKLIAAEELEKVTDLTRRFSKLLEDPHPGLFTWNAFLGELRLEMIQALGAEEEKKDETMPKLSMTFTQDDVKKACAYYAASLNRTFENAEVRLTFRPEERDPRGSSGPSVTATITSKEPVEAP